MFERTIRYGFFAFLICLPIQTVWLWREVFIGGAKWQYGTIGLYGTDVFLLVAIFFSVLQSVARKKNSLDSVLADLIRHPVHSMLALLILWTGLSVFWAEDRALAWYFFFKLLLAGGVFFLMQSIRKCHSSEDGNSERIKERSSFFAGIMTAVSIVAMIEGVLGIGQFLSQSSFSSTLLGMHGYEPWQAGVSVLKNDAGRWLRAYGTFPHPNMFGAYCSVILTGLIGYFTLFGKRFSFIDPAFEPKSESAFPGFGVKYEMTAFFIMVLFLLSLLLSFSRAAWLGVFFGFLALAVKIRRQGSAEEKKNFKKISSVVVLAILVFSGALHSVIFPRFNGAIIQKEASVTERSTLIRQSGEIIREYPLLGVGAGNYTLAVMREYPEISVWEAQPVHNVFLLVFAESGAVGLALFIGFFGSICVRGFRDLFLKEKKENAIFFIAFLSLVPSLFLDHFLWDSHFGLFFLFLLAGLSMRKINT